MKAKKGAEMTIGTLVVIVLAVLVLAFLAYGFSTGWSNLWNQISPKIAKVNVDALRQTCLLACTTQQSYEYCCNNRTIYYQQNDAVISTTGTCESNLVKPEGCSLPCTNKETLCRVTVPATP